MPPQVSVMVVERACEDHDTCYTIFKDFITKFRAIIDSQSSNNRQLAVAIKGYGYFAAVSCLHQATHTVIRPHTTNYERTLVLIPHTQTLSHITIPSCAHPHTVTPSHICTNTCPHTANYALTPCAFIDRNTLTCSFTHTHTHTHTHTLTAMQGVPEAVRHSVHVQ